MDKCLEARTCTQEDALKAVKEDAVARGIPIRYPQQARVPPPLIIVNFERVSERMQVTSGSVKHTLRVGF